MDQMGVTKTQLAMSLTELSLISIVFLVVLFLAWFFTRRATFKEKVILIEKGVDVKDLKIIGNNNGQSLWLKIGILIIGISLGALLTVLLEKITAISVGAGLAIILLCAGISMIIANFVGNPKGNEK